MKKFIVGAALLSFSLFTNAEVTILSEILIGQAQHKISSTLKSDVSEENYSSSLNSDLFGFRLGIKLLDNVSFELAKYDHGKVANNFTISTPTMAPPSPSGATFLPSEFDTIVEVSIPIDIESIRLGIKGEMELFKNLSVNVRLGLAHWKYDGASPYLLTNLGPSSDKGGSGNDIYYSLGTEYQFTENFYVGLEYSLLKINETKDINNDVSGSYKHDIQDISVIIGWVF
jgi:opacity protein-like surface antigen